ncbi:MAG: type II toxin-antitoxin system VapC family toxin [Neisseriaceae bacterium]|nr:type II toxin-antitoxin system VapC family toxin [Neisseriaceae bacterium]
MSGIDLLLDTNALLYLLRGYACMQPYLSKQFGISVISEMELLSFAQNSEEDEKHIQSLIQDCAIFWLDNTVKNRTISIRKKYGIKLPDAIIAATAIENNLPLLTADKVFKRVSELDLNLLEP